VKFTIFLNQLFGVKVSVIDIIRRIRMKASSKPRRNTVTTSRRRVSGDRAEKYKDKEIEAPQGKLGGGLF
jgi:hypothetical protein